MLERLIGGWRCFSVLWRLLLGFSSVIASICGGFVLAVASLREAGALLQGGVADAGALARAGAALARAEWLFWGALGFGLLLGCVLIVTLTLSIVAPLARLRASAERLGRGDLSEAYQLRHSDEVGQMARALATVSAQTAVVVRGIQDGAGQVAQAAGELASGHADLRRRTEMASARLEETAGATAHINEMARQAASCAAQAMARADAAASLAAEGGAAIADVGTAVGRIGQATRRMADFVGVIQQIAFQTNILALNAAVEAARAGAAGAGFSVVAAEVRSLAARSTTAAREVEELIRATLATGDAGSVQCERAGATMAQICDGVAQLALQVGAITLTATEQRNSVAEVAQSLAELEQDGQRNAALVEQATATSGWLREQSLVLDQAAALFTLPAAAARTGARHAVPHNTKHRGVPAVRASA
jgi:methyl-accepting chemotaxis protein